LSETVFPVGSLNVIIIGSDGVAILSVR
jgi:hypothetical protein